MAMRKWQRVASLGLAMAAMVSSAHAAPLAASMAGSVASGADTAMAVKFPLRASAEGRFLVDAAGKPFFYQADTPWMLLFRLSLPEAEEYLADRKARGFSALQIMMTGFMGMKNREGQAPFGADNDFARPNEAFFAHADKVIQKASDMGMLLTIAPLWSGCCGEGWAGKEKDGKLKPLSLNGPDKARAWGRWLGQRYRKYLNVAWLMGGDHNPDESLDLIKQMARGIHEAAPGQLMAVHNAPNNSSAASYDGEPWLSLNAAYTYDEVFKHVLSEWNRPKARPIFLSESGYEHESNDGRGGVPWRLRRQAYGAILSGALAGHAYGHHELWPVTGKWREALRDTGSAQMTYVRRLFAACAWWKLVPEVGEALVTQGRGKIGDVDYVTAARAADGSLAIAYLPQARAVTIDLSRMSAPIRASWFDPTNGSLQPVQDRALPNAGSRQFAPPEKNAAGESDWVLLLEATR